MKEINFELKLPVFKFSSRRRFQIKAALSLLAVAGAFLLGRNFEYTFFGILILAYFGISLIWSVSSRIAAFLALLFLASCPILLSFKKGDLAETFAVYAFYFLVITVFQELLLLLKKASKKG